MQGTCARLTIQTARGKQPDSNEGIQTPFRLIHYISPEDLHEYHCITNAMHLPAQTIADIFYKERWQIELFLKWVKQNLKIKTFLGTSANAVMTQVWVALCLYLILAFIRFISKTVHSMREILNWIRINLFQTKFSTIISYPR